MRLCTDAHFLNLGARSSLLAPLLGGLEVPADPYAGGIMGTKMPRADSTEQGVSKGTQASRAGPALPAQPLK